MLLFFYHENTVFIYRNKNRFFNINMVKGIYLYFILLVFSIFISNECVFFSNINNFKMKKTNILKNIIS